jgi:AMP-binding enzyme
MTLHPSHHARTMPDKPAYRMVGSGSAITYGELDRVSDQGARQRRALGLKPEDHIALLAENSLHFFEICWAAIIVVAHSRVAQGADAGDLDIDRVAVLDVFGSAFGDRPHHVAEIEGERLCWEHAGENESEVPSDSPLEEDGFELLVPLVKVSSKLVENSARAVGEARYRSDQIVKCRAADAQGLRESCGKSP